MFRFLVAWASVEQIEPTSISDGPIHSKTLGCRKIMYVFMDV